MIFRASLRRKSVVAGIAVTASVAAVATASPGQSSQPEEVDLAMLALPGPNQFVSGLDLECFDTPGPSLNISLQLKHLNPVLIQLGLPTHTVTVGALMQTCVPVQKNGVPPQPAALPFIQQTDLACYKIDASPVPIPPTLTLKHLNPVLAGLPSHTVILRQPVQLCVPVAKNGVVPTPDVLRLVQFIDLECYSTAASTHPAFGVNLMQLNPQLANIPGQGMTLVSSPRQMCVPVQKNSQVIPTDVQGIVQWIDLEKFQASPIVALPASVSVVLRHLNPLLTTFPQVPVVLQQASALMVPVSKNGAAPPAP